MLEANERKVGSDGLVKLDLVTGSDAYICRVARSTAGAEKVKLPEDDRGLLRYLVRHMHTTPVEFGEAVFFLRIQMDAWRQMVRHRTACLAGDTLLHFDLPGGVERRGNQLDSLSVKEVYDRFQPTENAQPSKQGNPFYKRDRVQARLLRSLNEETGEVRHTQIVDIWESGEKEVYEVRFEGRTVKASKDHLFLTNRGWRALGQVAELSTGKGGCVLVPDVEFAYIGPGRDNAVEASFNTIDPDTEGWEPVVGWEEYYQVSNQGRVRRVVGGKGSRSFGRCKTLTVVKGRAVVSLNRPGTQETRLVHQLIMEAFEGPCPDGLEVCHENGNGLDNRVENLRYGTPASNAADRVRDGATTRLSRSFVVPFVRYAGTEMTYDLEVVGPWHNFSAAGFVVHNSINEYSTRYRPAIDEAFGLDPDQWRLQSKANRQGSSGGVVEFKTPGKDAWPAGYTVKAIKDHTPHAGPDGTSDWVFDPLGEAICPAALTPGEYLSQRQDEIQRQARQVYEERVSLGVAFEVARKDLPLSTYTELYWKCDLNNIFRFLSLRMHGHAQKEIREYAEAMYELLKPHFPMLFEAFDDFDPRRGGLLLSRLDVEVIRGLMGHLVPDPSHPDWLSLLGKTQPAYWTEFEQWQRDQGRKVIRVGERDECLEKLKRLGIVPPDLTV